MYCCIKIRAKETSKWHLYHYLLFYLRGELLENIVAKWDFKSRFDSRDFVQRKCAHASFLHRRKRVPASFCKKKKKAICILGRVLCRKSGFFSFTPISLYSHHQAIFPGEFSPIVSWRATGHRWPVLLKLSATDFNLQVELFRASQTQLPSRAAAVCSRRQFAISCQFYYLVLRAPATQPGMQWRHILSALRFKSTKRRASILWGEGYSHRHPMQPNRSNEFDKRNLRRSFWVTTIRSQRASDSVDSVDSRIAVKYWQLVKLNVDIEKL